MMNAALSARVMQSTRDSVYIAIRHTDYRDDLVAFHSLNVLRTTPMIVVAHDVQLLNKRQQARRKPSHQQQLSKQQASARILASASWPDLRRFIVPAKPFSEAFLHSPLFHLLHQPGIHSDYMPRAANMKPSSCLVLFLSAFCSLYRDPDHNFLI